MSHAWREDEALRIILHAAAERIEPAGDGLELIRSRLCTPQPTALAWASVARTRLSLRWETMRDLRAASAHQTHQLAGRLLASLAGLAAACGHWLAAQFGRLTRWLGQLAAGLDRLAARLGWHGLPVSSSQRRVRQLGHWLASQYGQLDGRLGRFRWMRPVGAMATAVVLIGAVVYMAAGVSQVISPANTEVGSGAQSGQSQGGGGASGQGANSTRIGNDVPGVTKNHRHNLFARPCATPSPTTTQTPHPTPSISSPSPSPTPTPTPTPTSSSPSPSPSDTTTTPSPSPSVTPTNAPVSPAPNADTSSPVPDAAEWRATELLSNVGGPAGVTPGPIAATCATPTPTTSSSAASPAAGTPPNAAGSLTLTFGSGWTGRPARE